MLQPVMLQPVMLRRTETIASTEAISIQTYQDMTTTKETESGKSVWNMVELQLALEEL